MFDLLGDLRTRTRWAAGNTAFVERDFARRLRGYDDRPTLVEVKNPKTGVSQRVIRYDYRELVPLARHRYDPASPEVRRVLDRPRDIHMSIDARLSVRVAAILRATLERAGLQKGAAVVLDPSSGDLLAAVSLPLPPDRPQAEPAAEQANPFLDRARFGLYPPGSTFKVVTAMAALRKDPRLADKTYECIRLPDGRVGNFIKGSKRPIRDDIQDQAPHGTVNMERGIVLSCNAYFAQLGAYDVGAEPLLETAGLLGISVAAPATAAQLRKSLPQSSYGQGQVVASPFQMARVAATVATGGAMPQGRWITDETNPRTAPPQPVLDRRCRRHAGQVHARGGDLRHRTPRRGVRSHRRQDRHRRTGRRAFARLVHRLRSLWRRRRAKSPSPSWWKMECTAARPPRPPPRKSPKRRCELGLIQP